MVSKGIPIRRLLPSGALDRKERPMWHVKFKKSPCRMSQSLNDPFVKVVTFRKIPCHMSLKCLTSCHVEG